MQNRETSWRKDGDWKKRYSKLYSSQGTIQTREEDRSRISFMSAASTPNKSLLLSNDPIQKKSAETDQSTLEYINSIMSHRSDIYTSRRNSLVSEDLGGHGTKLLDMVRARSREIQDETLSKPLDIPVDEASDDQSSEACVHVMSMRVTDRSVSRSRVSRISTRRDMDIPSILAFTASNTAPVQNEIPAFQNINQSQPQADIPRWSIRRSVCPVCSQRWKDKSTIRNIKYSGIIKICLGLKKNSTLELPSVIAPARLRTKITMAYVPRPALPVVDEDLPGYGKMRNTSATWQLTRARRFRAPKPVMPSPEAAAPPTAAAPLAQKDLDLRVNKFLMDEDTIVKL